MLTFCLFADVHCMSSRDSLQVTCITAICESAVLCYSSSLSNSVD